MEATKAVKCQNCFAALDLSQATSRVVKCEYCMTDNVLGQSLSVLVQEGNAALNLQIAKVMGNTFSKEELKLFVACLNPRLKHHRLNIENLAGVGPQGISVSMVQWAARRLQIQALLDTLLDERPELIVHFMDFGAK